MIMVFILPILRVKCSPAGTLKYAFKNIGYQIKSVFVSLRLLVTGKLGLDDVSGPVGIVSFIGEVVDEAKSDGAFYVFINLLNMCIMIKCQPWCNESIAVACT